MADKKKRGKEKPPSKKADAKKRNADADEEGSGYEFPMPEFDEVAFMRREMESARTTFWTAGLGLIAGAAAYGVHTAVGNYRLGFLIVILIAATLGPLLRKLGYSEDATSPKSLLGNWFFMFFTALAVWILALNLL